MISIVTITYNNFEELKNTLNSIPKYDFIDSVVINGGNDKKTVEWLKGYNGLVINESDLGIADAFNKGIINSSGSSIMFLNSGDLLLNKKYLIKAYEQLKNEDIYFIHSNLIFQDVLGVQLTMKPQMQSLGRGMPFFHPTMIVKRKVFEEIGDFNKNFKIAMDFDFTVRLIKNNFSGLYLDYAPVVLMDGKGKSSISEFHAIRECTSSLLLNNYFTLNNFVGLVKRFSLFLFRKILVLIGAKEVLKKMKVRKYLA